MKKLEISRKDLKGNISLIVKKASTSAFQIVSII